MNIETYLIEEAEALICDPEELDEWKAKIADLELEGQQSLAEPEKSPIPFQRLSEEEVRVYETVFPNKAKVESYSDMAIPLKLLSLIALAKQESYFNRIEIWHNHSEPDPLVIGREKDYAGKVWILGRWAEAVLPTFDELKQKAKKILVEKRRAKVQGALAQLRAAEDNLESDIDLYLLGERISDYISI